MCFPRLFSQIFHFWLAKHWGEWPWCVACHQYGCSKSTQPGCVSLFCSKQSRFLAHHRLWQRRLLFFNNTMFYTWKRINNKSYYWQWFSGGIWFCAEHEAWIVFQNPDEGLAALAGSNLDFKSRPGPGVGEREGGIRYVWIRNSATRVGRFRGFAPHCSVCVPNMFYTFIFAIF